MSAALLDTHAFLWATLDDPRLSKAARDFIESSESVLYLSAVSALEIAIKVSSGRMDLPEPPGSYVRSRLSKLDLLALPVSVAHALKVANLPHIHGDPFDRLLVAQAQIEGLPILTADPQIGRYDVEIIW